GELIRDEETGFEYYAQENDENIRAWYNALEDRIEVNVVRVQGGYMELFGQILSTGNGELRVMDGYGRITIDNDTTHPLLINKLDTGRGVAGVLKITDTGNTNAEGQPLVTTYERLGGNVEVTKHYFVVPGEGSFDPALDVVANEIDLGLRRDGVTPNHDLSLDDEVVYSSGGKAPVGGLTDGGVYYVTSVSGSRIQLAHSVGEAEIQLTATGDVGSSHSITKIVSKVIHANTRADQYTPESAGYRYYWTTGNDLTSSTTVTYGESSWLGIDAFAPDPDNIVDGPHVTFDNPRPIRDGAYTASPGNLADYTYEFERIPRDPAEQTEVVRQWEDTNWIGTTTYYRTERTWRDQKDIHTHSIRADRPIDIVFQGYDEGAAGVQSRESVAEAHGLRPDGLSCRCLWSAGQSAATLETAKARQGRQDLQ
ncbi:hypothetical protein LCGC14_2721400, partial [marine sediment metagenome]